MKRLPPPQPLTLGLAVLGSAVVLGVASWAMSSLARPSHYENRLAALEESLAEIERGVAGQRDPAVSEKTLCRGALLPAASALRSGLVRRAGEVGMTVRDVDVAPGAAVGSLAGIDVAFTAQGSYEGAVRLTGLLQGMSPEVFVDSAEIAPTNGKVSLKVKGRAFCWTSARQ